MQDDIAALHSTIDEFVNEEKDVVLVLHSGSGFLCSNAIEGFGIRARNEKGRRGGVSKIVFVTAAVFSRRLRAWATAVFNPGDKTPEYSTSTLDSCAYTL